VEYDTGDVNDTNALAQMAMQTKEILGVNKMNVLADKGYHTGEQLEQCQKNDITTYVSPKAPATKDIGLYPITAFSYDPVKDVYICPQQQEMKTNNTWHNHSDKRIGRKGAYRFRRYNTTACKTCTSRHLCTQSKTNGRYIDRSEYADVVEENAERVNQNPDYYRKRQQITEHMFGTLKRQRGFTFTLVRGKANVLGEVGLMFIGYNLSRCISILGAENLIKALRECCLLIANRLYRLFQELFKNLKPVMIKSTTDQKVNVQSFNRLLLQ
jgi:hypothetical protein